MEEDEAMQRDKEDDYFDQEEPEEMKMETEGCEEESDLKMQTEPIEVAEILTGTLAEAAPQEPAQFGEPVQQTDRLIGTEATP